MLTLECFLYAVFINHNSSLYSFLACDKYISVFTFSFQYMVIFNSWFLYNLSCCHLICNIVFTLFRLREKKLSTLSWLINCCHLICNKVFHTFGSRGTTLAKFLIDGDPQGKLRKSVQELEKYDQKGLSECKRLAIGHSKQLFEIYQKKNDPFFLSS